MRFPYTLLDDIRRERHALVTFSVFFLLSTECRILTDVATYQKVLQKNHILRGGTTKRELITKAKGGEGKRQTVTKGKGRTKMAIKNQRRPTLFAPGLRTPLIFRKMEIV